MSAKRKPSIASKAPALVPSSPEDYYAATFDMFATLLAHRPRGDALNVQLLHYLPYPIFTSNRDVISWALSGAMVSLLAHLTGGAHEKKLHRTRNQGMAAWMPILRHLLEPWDTLILAHTATSGIGLVWSELILARVAYWHTHDGEKFERWTKALNVAARSQRQQTMARLGDPLFPEAARIIIAELKVMLARLSNQSLSNRRPVDLVQFFQRQAESHEFGFLNDPHNLHLWLEFVSRNSTVFRTQGKSPGAIFDLFVASVKGHNPDYVRQKRARG
ncbi:MAG: hypothetical protein WBZ01_19670 [Terriglobales bacterium]